MRLVETPIQMITDSISLFVLACFMNDAVRRGTITPSCLQEQINLGEGGEWGITITKPHSGDELKHGTRNLMLITLGTTAIATNKALEFVYGYVRPTDTSQQGSAQVLLYQIRCAFAHDPMNPIWASTPKYDHHYRVTVSVNRPASEPTMERTIQFHPPSLKDRPLNPEHFGGLGGYLGLLQYFQKIVKDHPKGNQSYRSSLNRH